jgi:hypothetical protein
LKEEHKLTVSENRGLRRMFGPMAWSLIKQWILLLLLLKREEVTEGWRKLHNEVRNTYIVLIGKP